MGRPGERCVTWESASQCEQCVKVLITVLVFRTTPWTHTAFGHCHGLAVETQPSILWACFPRSDTSWVELLPFTFPSKPSIPCKAGRAAWSHAVHWSGHLHPVTVPLSCVSLWAEVSLYGRSLEPCFRLWSEDSPLSPPFICSVPSLASQTKCFAQDLSLNKNSHGKHKCLRSFCKVLWSHIF